MQSLKNACKNTTFSPVSPSKTLSSLSQWIFGNNNNNNNHEQQHQNLQLLTPTPISLRTSTTFTSSKNNILVENVSVCVLKNPQETLAHQQKQQLHNLLLPYVVAAFQQNFDTISDAGIQEHCEHQLFGDYLFLAVANCKEGEEAKGNVEHALIESEVCDGLFVKPVAPLVIFHLLSSSIEIDIQGIYSNIVATGDASSSNENNHNNRTVMCGAGYCCDPNFQKTGVATLVHNIAVREYLKPQAIMLRTVNIAIVKLLKRNAPPGSRLYPNDLILENNSTTTTTTTASTFKFSSKDQEWLFARSIAADALHKWSQLATDAAKYDPERLVFRDVYSTDNGEFFNKISSSSSSEPNSPVVSEDIKVKPGDAQLRILVLPF